MSDYSPKRVGEVEIITVDYVLLLASGETITSASWSNSVVRGTDAYASSMIQGATSISGSKVSTKITAGIVGVFYAPICTALTSAGQTLILPEYGNGILQVTP